MIKIDIKGFLNRSKDATERSVPTLKTLHGVQIKKLPNGAYIAALNKAQNLPETLLKGCFPGEDIDNIIKSFENINTDGIVNLVGRLLTCVPEQFLKFVSDVSDIPFDTLMYKLTPKETLDILEALWRLNDLGPFFTRLIKKARGNKILQSLTSEQN